jgi:hypothetical protein
MKRTKQRFDHGEQATPQYVSGCRQFEGEDLCMLLIMKIMNIYSICRQNEAKCRYPKGLGPSTNQRKEEQSIPREDGRIVTTTNFIIHCIEHTQSKQMH